MPVFSRRIVYDRKRLLDRARRLESGWRWRRALSLYRQVLAAEPYDPELHSRIAPLLARSRRRYEARESFRIAQSEFRRNGDTARAAEMIAAASEALPQDPDVARQRARFERANNRPDVAMRHLLETSDRIAWRRRGESIILLREANSIDSRHPQVLIRLSRLLFRDGQPAEALFWLDQLDGRVGGPELVDVMRLRLRIDPTFRNLWAWMRCRSDCEMRSTRRPNIRIA